MKIQPRNAANPLDSSVCALVRFSCAVFEVAPYIPGHLADTLVRIKKVSTFFSVSMCENASEGLFRVSARETPPTHVRARTMRLSPLRA